MKKGIKRGIVGLVVAVSLTFVFGLKSPVYADNSGGSASGTTGGSSSNSSSTSGGSGSSGSSSGGSLSNDCVSTSIIGGGQYCDDGGGSGIMDILKIAVDILTFGIGTAAVVGIVISAIQYIMAADNVGQLQKAKVRIFHIVIGLAIYAIFWGILQFLLPGGLLNIG